MKKIIILAAMISAIATLGACGTPCDAAADRIEAKNAECEIEVEDGGEEGEAEEEECTEEDGVEQGCFADCYEEAPCSAFANSNEEVVVDDQIAFGECITACTE